MDKIKSRFISTLFSFVEAGGIIPYFYHFVNSLEEEYFSKFAQKFLVIFTIKLFQFFLFLLLTFCSICDIMYTEKEREVFNNDKTKS